jgi:hypothetical protein
MLQDLRQERVERRALEANNAELEVELEKAAGEKDQGRLEEDRLTNHVREFENERLVFVRELDRVRAELREKTMAFGAFLYDFLCVNIKVLKEEKEKHTVVLAK